MEGNFLQAIVGCLFLLFIFGFCGWQLYTTRQAKKRRIAREQARARDDGAI